MSKAWKDFEREVAKTFHGRRNIRVSYAESTCDVIHATLALECKWGKQVPEYLCVAGPVCYQVSGKSYVVCPVSKLTREGLNGLEVQQRAEVKFLTNGLMQAAGYPENAGKFPVLCCKRPKMRGFIVAFNLEEQAC
jgi:hypothetical protein